MRPSISAEECLAVTLRFLATGESYASLEFQYRASRSTLSTSIPDACYAIYQVLFAEYMKCPSEEVEWLKIASQFEEKWNLPNCLGAGDGIHIRLKYPSNSGSTLYNYKYFFSIALLAFVGPQYQFLYVDVGCQGSTSDAGVFKKSTLWNAVENNTIYISKPRPLAQSDDLMLEACDTEIDHVFACDDAFPLGKHLMKTYPSRNLTKKKRMFNYHF